MTRVRARGRLEWCACRNSCIFFTFTAGERLENRFFLGRVIVGAPKRRTKRARCTVPVMIRAFLRAMVTRESPARKQSHREVVDEQIAMDRYSRRGPDRRRLRERVGTRWGGGPNARKRGGVPHRGGRPCAGDGVAQSGTVRDRAGKAGWKDLGAAHRRRRRGRPHARRGGRKHKEAARRLYSRSQCRRNHYGIALARVPLACARDRCGTYPKIDAIPPG